MENRQPDGAAHQLLDGNNIRLLFLASGCRNNQPWRNGSEKVDGFPFLLVR